MSVKILRIMTNKNVLSTIIITVATVVFVQLLLSLQNQRVGTGFFGYYTYSVVLKKSVKSKF